MSTADPPPESDAGADPGQGPQSPSSGQEGPQSPASGQQGPQSPPPGQGQPQQPPAQDWSQGQAGQPPPPPAGGGQWQYTQAGWQQTGSPDTNGKAITSLILGILGLVFCPLLASIAALIVGYQARTEIDQSQGYQGGRGLAVAGIVLGWVGVGLVVLGIVLLLALAAAGTS